ncbi:FAD-binding protein [Spirochaetia bacterium]|nr:FAD-binding protein [Spirochaetia bacterium]
MWNRFPDAILFAGGTEHLHLQGQRLVHLSGMVLFLDKLDDIQKITRTERYLELGAMVRLSTIRSLGKAVPEILVQCLEHLADPYIREIATIGGNIACNGDLNAPFLALDAQYEVRSGASTRWISYSRLFSPKSMLEPQTLLSRIRIPLGQWNYHRYNKFESPIIGDRASVCVIIARIEKDMIVDIRLVITASDRYFRNREHERILAGKHLPISQQDFYSFIDHWKESLSKSDFRSFVQKNIIDFLESNLLELCD